MSMLAILFFISPFSACVHGYQLKQVIVLGRHGIRTPLNPNVADYTSKHWPVWSKKPGHLTEKGARIERYMGKYFSDWLSAEKLLNDCPKDDVYVYSNTRERTIRTAKSFVDGAFGDCVQPYHKNTTKPDPVFYPAVTNTSQAFKDLVVQEINKELEGIDLKAEFAELERILDFKHSPFCKRTKVCELGKVENEVSLELDEDLDVYGSLMIANHIVDNFLMAYYDGKEEKDVAWGGITTTEQFKALMNLKHKYYDVRFKTPLLRKHNGQLLLEYMSDLFLAGEKKFYLLVGHDSNIDIFLYSLNFEPYELHDQIERTPIGGKVVFEKWYDEVNDRYLMRVDYVYQSLQQIREGAVIGLDNPPQRALLRMKQCAVDDYGFCLWNDFIILLNNALNI